MGGTHTSIVMFPVFSSNGLTAFTGIEENNGKTLSPFVRSGTHCRFMMSEHDGSEVSARQTADEPDKITIFAKQTPNGRERVSQAYVIHAASLRALAQRATNGVAGVAEFEQALGAALVLYSTRPCKICGGPAHVVCGCKLSFGLRRHPLDYSRVQKITTAPLGHYNGFGVVEYFDHGHVRSITALGTSWNGVRSASLGESNRLLSGVITQRLAETASTVFRSVSDNGPRPLARIASEPWGDLAEPGRAFARGGGAENNLDEPVGNTNGASPTLPGNQRSTGDQPPQPVALSNVAGVGAITAHYVQVAINNRSDGSQFTRPSD